MTDTLLFCAAISWRAIAEGAWEGAEWELGLAGGRLPPLRGAEGERWMAIGIPAGIEDPKGWRGDSGLVGKGGWKRGILVQYLLLILRGF